MNMKKRHLHKGHLMTIVYWIVGIWVFTQGLFLLGVFLMPHLPNEIILDSRGNKVPAWLLGLCSILAIFCVLGILYASYLIVKWFYHRFMDIYNYIFPASWDR